MLKTILNNFYPDIFLLATVNVNLIDEKLLLIAEDQLKVNNTKFENKLDRFWFVHPLYLELAIYYQKINKKNQKNITTGNNEQSVT